MTTVDVAIVGAGIAGIKAATELHSKGLSTLLLEARDRIGGRLYTYHPPNSEYDYDIGACWFHATVSNPLFHNALQKKNVEYFFDENSAAVIGPEGPLTANVGPIVEEIKLYAQSRPGEDVNLKTACAEYLTRMGPTLSDEQKKWAPSLLRLAEIPNGMQWDMFSARLANPPYVGRDAFVSGGYKRVLESEIEGYPSESIWTETVVKKIEQTDSGYKITTETGDALYSKFVVVTIPQSVLKLSVEDPNAKGAITFVPDLPKSITDNFSKTHFCALGKVIYEYDEDFWPATEKFVVIPKPDESVSTSTSFPTSEYNKKLTEEEADKLEAFDFPVLAVNLKIVKNAPALMFLVPAPASHLLEENVEKYGPKLLEPIIAKLSGRKQTELPKPKLVFSTNWSSDPFSRGSVSGNAVGDVLVNEGLIEGVKGLRFAGEAYCYEGHTGAHGAYISGKREADFILKQLGY
ncbi:hypothetical protein KL928_001175 [Ogataea angusta]|uniref:Amine oxidase domain-containing protein n=1 Tax=Pichia angusta TaxID=870730 RepID=A0AAN6DHP4_PICAN|nr:uncharacterized protein KL928_001175 [Ogataea angusta]KAG7821091.1 hypothetical protein KL928_001175 [Ogataea angusta]KAG7836217.1 hypothetical protein KL943_001866 [Ogataea angusta]